ncbi:MAG TPA: FAD-dependent oxidoreductase [Candidatus Angelobacter sp.]|nr:FAD-dependent oxidoreductase [Candidatus Angelobacter sp.]
MQTMNYAVAIVGGGLAGMATAARLQAVGLTTLVLEAHGLPGGCAGYFTHKGFSFDVGATTLVDFGWGGVGRQFLDEIGCQLPPADLLDYKAWLPDRTVCLWRDSDRWAKERLERFGSPLNCSPQNYRAFWSLLDRLASTFWSATRQGATMPLRRPADLWRNLSAIEPRNFHLLRYVTWTMADAMRAHGVYSDVALRTFIGMLVEDTLHTTVEEAPLINAALGITIRGAALMRARGGMRGFWNALVSRYNSLGGTLKVGHSVLRIEQTAAGYDLHTSKGIFQAGSVVSALPVANTYRIAPDAVKKRLRAHVRRERSRLGGALVAFLGVPEDEVCGEPFTHHQLFQDYDRPFGNGNNMFISVSSSGDLLSAPAGYRSVMISTHCRLEEWENLSPQDYARRKEAAQSSLLKYARRVYPRLGERAVVSRFATPGTYLKFTRRHRGAVGGVRQTLWNTNFFALSQNIGLSNFFLVGDSTWPGLGTVACIVGSRIAAQAVLENLDCLRSNAHRNHKTGRILARAIPIELGGRVAEE